MPAHVQVHEPPANVTFQGIVVPGSTLNPNEFFAGTRRQRVLLKTFSKWQGFGNTDISTTLRAGILAGYYVTLRGVLKVTPGSGTVATTARWPYYVLRTGRFQANGQSNLVNADGWFLRAREFMANPDFSDRGVKAGIGGASPGTTRQQGTLKLASESWGVGSNVTAIATGSYTVTISFYVPVAYEKRFLTGSVFCQTNSTTLELDMTWANKSDLFTLTGNAAVTFTPTVIVEAEMFTIPSDGKGGMFLPNLSAFHSFTQVKAQNSISNGNNEITLSGQGVGRQLMKLLWRTQNGAPVTPIIPTAKHITSPYWRYGTNTTPETFIDGQALRVTNERSYNGDIAGFAGFEAFDWDKTYAFRDSITEGSATELRFGYTISGTVTLSGTPYNEYAQDVILAGAAA